MQESEIAERVETFKSVVVTSSNREVIRGHIFHGEPAILSNEAYFRLKAEVADNFHLHPNDVLIVGSAKLGFSIAPNKRYRAFHDKSDIDVVLISSNIFDEVWISVFDFWNQGGYWGKEQEFKDYLFRGWIRPDAFPSARKFSVCAQWWDFFQELTSSGRYGDYKIRGALYKSWHFIESYQEICVQSCREELTR